MVVVRAAASRAPWPGEGAGARAGRAALGGGGAMLAKVGRPRPMRSPWARGRARVRAPDGRVERRARGCRACCGRSQAGAKPASSTLVHSRRGSRVEEDDEDESQPHRLNSPGPAVSLLPFTSSALLITRTRSSVLVQRRELAAPLPPQPESRCACRFPGLGAAPPLTALPLQRSAHYTAVRQCERATTP